MTPENKIEHLEAWLTKKEAEYKETTSSWGAGYQRAIEDVQLEMERLDKDLTPRVNKPYEFSKH